MDKFKQWPVVLRRKWLLSLAMGAMFFIVGLVMFFTLRDRTLLFISFLLTLCVLQRCHSFYQMAQEETYEVIEGVCISLDRAILRKRQSVRLLQYDGNECALTLDKRTSLRIGNCYRVYLKPDINSGYEVPVLDVFFEQDRILGLENLGEYHFEGSGAEHIQKTE